MIDVHNNLIVQYRSLCILHKIRNFHIYIYIYIALAQAVVTSTHLAQEKKRASYFPVSYKSNPYKDSVSLSLYAEAS